KVGGQYYFYQNDHLGTPQKLTAVNGAVVWSVKYFSFGKADVDASSSITNNLRFAGQYFDQESGLHYNYNR
ncbi:Rhs-family protein, partial [Olavius sp. associated proteobacterium Delta 1]